MYGAAQERDLPVTFIDQAPDGFVGNAFTIVDDLETVEIVQAPVELNDRDLVFYYLAEMIGDLGFFRVGNKDAIDILMYQGLDGLTFLIVGLMGLADYQAVIVRETYLFDAGDSIGEKALIDLGDNDSDGPRLAPTKIGSPGIVLIVKLFRLFLDTLPDRFANRRMVIESFGNIGGRNAQFPGKVIDSRSFLAIHFNSFNNEIKLKVQNIRGLNNRLKIAIYFALSMDM